MITGVFIVTKRHSLKPNWLVVINYYHHQLTLTIITHHQQSFFVNLTKKHRHSEPSEKTIGYSHNDQLITLITYYVNPLTSNELLESFPAIRSLNDSGGSPEAPDLRGSLRLGSLSGNASPQQRAVGQPLRSGWGAMIYLMVIHVVNHWFNKEGFLQDQAMNNQ